MKRILTTLTLIISMTALADIWEKPVYTPDENHLPSEQQMQEEQQIQERQHDKKHQEVKTPDDQIKKDTKLENSENEEELKRK